MVINPVATVYLLFSGLFSFAIACSFATYVPFLAEKGMNLWQINVINSFFMLFIILAEMPTGSFADIFGRHHSVTISCFLMFISGLVYYFSQSFWLFILAEIIGAFGHTFVSGAAEAWMVDSLKHRNEFSLKEKIFRQELNSKAVGAIAGCLTGSWLGNFNLSWPWLATATFMFLAGVFSLFFIKENYQTDVVKKVKNSINNQIITAWHSGLKNKALVYVMSFAALLACSFQAVNMQWTLVFKESYHFDSSHLGYLFVSVSLVVAAGGKLSKYFKRWFKNDKLMLIIPQLLTAGALIVTSQVTGVTLVTSIFLLHEFGRGMFSPIKQNYINNQIESDKRATLLSLESMFTKLGCFIGLIISGFTASAFGINNTWLGSGIFLFLGIIIFFIILKKKKF